MLKKAQNEIYFFGRQKIEDEVASVQWTGETRTFEF
jgi:hypothetical protein